MTESPLILVVDDEANFREIISAQLGASGFRVEVAEDGPQALIRIQETKPDLVLLDMKMPGMDGAKFLEELRGNSEIKDTKVVFLSSFGDLREAGREVDIHFAKQAGALDYINKTEIDTKLVSRIKEILSL